MKHDAIEEKMTVFLERCRAEGVTITHQRTELYRVLIGSKEHPDAETLYQQLKVCIPALSLDTVYRNLRTLEEHAMIRRVDEGTRSRYDGNIAPHHHFICTRCGMIRDFYNHELDTFKPPAGVAELGETHTIQVALRGVCRGCISEEKHKKNNKNKQKE